VKDGQNTRSAVSGFAGRVTEALVDALRAVASEPDLHQKQCGADDFGTGPVLRQRARSAR